jgi:phosphatidate cytidylyltransferase
VEDPVPTTPPTTPGKSDRRRYGAILIGAIAVTACLELWITKGAPTVLVVGFLAIACAVETASMLRAARCEPFARVCIPIAVAIVLAHSIAHLQQSFAPNSARTVLRDFSTPELGLAGFALFCCACVLRGKTEDAAQTLGGGALVLWVPVSILSLVDVRYAGGSPEPANLQLLLFLVSVSKIGDIAAYFVGSAAGKHKLIPSVSPGKSWEGAAASLFASVGLAAILGMVRFSGGLTPDLAVVAGCLINVTSQFGDLVESLLKRSAGFKDSGHWIPQFGGAFDLVDSLLLSGPVFYGFLRIAPHG